MPFRKKRMRALGVRHDKKVIVVPAPRRSRGCAEVGQGHREGEAVVISIAPPTMFRMKRFARLFEHEFTHTGHGGKSGKHHEEMDESTLWSLGDVPAWARGLQIRYRGRAPNQL
jgi:tartrate dehydratase beta subunit/fumarate hydratase class I family protein